MILHLNRARLRRTIAALLMLVVGGAAVRALSSPSVSATTMNNFVIIFRQGPRPLSPEDIALRQREIVEWARVHNAAGHKLEPRALASEIRRPGLEQGTEGWPLTALVFLQARDLEQASEIARVHPANRFGASVEVRAWSNPAAQASAPNQRDAE